MHMETHLDRIVKPEAVDVHDVSKILIKIDY